MGCRELNSPSLIHFRDLLLAIHAPYAIPLSHYVISAEDTDGASVLRETAKPSLIHFLLTMKEAGL